MSTGFKKWLFVLSATSAAILYLILLSNINVLMTAYGSSSFVKAIAQKIDPNIVPICSAILIAIVGIAVILQIILPKKKKEK